MTVHVFGAVDSPCCANYALQRAARDQQGNFSEDAIHAVGRNFYMDDLLASKQSSDEATGLAKDPPYKMDVEQPRSAYSNPLI